MSSTAVRTAVLDFLEDNLPSETVIDISAAHEEIQELLNENGVQPDAPWLGVRFVGGEEIPIALAATNDQGKYREFGSVIIDICEAARIGAGAAMLPRFEALKNLFRGQRIGGIVVVDGMTMLNTEIGATLEFEGGYVSGSFQVTFYRDVDL